MNTVEVTLTLPADLVSRAKDAGIFQDARMARIILQRKNSHLQC